MESDRPEGVLGAHPRIPVLGDRLLLQGHPSRSFRVDGWYREVPPAPPALAECDCRAEHALLTAIFQKLHPDPSKEVRLVRCAREEATHVSGQTNHGMGILAGL
jgi:hypothetical protein